MSISWKKRLAFNYLAAKMYKNLISVPALTFIQVPAFLLI